MEITRDDWELTLKELESQLLQVTLQASVLTGGILHVKKQIRTFPPKPEEKKQQIAGVV